MPRGKAIRNKNGYGSVVKLSGNRRQPYEVRVNTRMDERYYPVYDVLGRFENREDAQIALAEYNKSPYDINQANMTFSELYKVYYRDKYELSGKQYSVSSINCTRSAYNHMQALHGRVYKDLRTNDFKSVLGQQDKNGKPLSHALQEHIKNLMNQMDRFAMQNDIINKSYSEFAKITVDDDDQPGVPFTGDEILQLWKHKDVPNVDIALIYIYSGWRISELCNMPTSDIDLKSWTFTGGVKTAAGKHRTVPIHSAIRDMVQSRMLDNGSRLFIEQGKPVNVNKLQRLFKSAISAAGITSEHTVHDCRHTFTSLLDSAGANAVCIDRLVGHASDNVTKKVYTHKEFEELRTAIEMLKAPEL